MTVTVIVLTREIGGYPIPCGAGGGPRVSHQKRYIPTLDGWRALSVIGVILYHGRSSFFGSDSLLWQLSSHGNLGVDVFFAISGFLICGLLLHEYERNGDINLRRFYIDGVFAFCLRITPSWPQFVPFRSLARSV